GRPAGVGLGHRAHVDRDVRAEAREGVAVVADPRAIAVDVRDFSELELVLATVEDRDVVTDREQPADDRRADEACPADDERAHTSIVRQGRRYALRRMELAVWAVAALSALGLIVLAVGLALPIDHVAIRTATFPTETEALWDAIHDPALALAAAVETEEIESVPPKLLVTKVVGEKAFG